jgi:glycosyltransferase involved in cell wall biosynthesis
VLVNEVTGIIVKPNDSQDLATGVIKVLRSDYRQMGMAARKIIEEKFALEQVVSQYERLAEELVQR